MSFKNSCQFSGLFSLGVHHARAAASRRSYKQQGIFNPCESWKTVSTSSKRISVNIDVDLYTLYCIYCKTIFIYIYIVYCICTNLWCLIAICSVTLGLLWDRKSPNQSESSANFMLTSHELSSYHPCTCSAPSITATSTSPQWSCHPRPKLCQLPGPWCEQCGQMVEGSDVHLVHCDSSNGITLVMGDECVKFAVGLWVFGRLLKTNYSRDLLLSTLQIVLHGSRGICWRPTKEC